MGTDGITSIVDIIIIVSGAYLIYGSIQLKTKQTLPTYFWSKDFPLSKCKDVPAFTAFMLPRLIISGAVILIDGVVGLAADRVEGLAILSLIAMVLAVVVIIWFMSFSKKAQREFF